jgi:hypothetical protein
MGKKRPTHALSDKLPAFTRDVSHYLRGSVSWKRTMHEFKRERMRQKKERSEEFGNEECVGCTLGVTWRAKVRCMGRGKVPRPT